MHGQEGEFLDHAVQKTEWIRKGLDATGKFVGVSAAIIAEQNLGETLTNTSNYWQEAYQNTKRKGSKMTAEEIAYQTTNLAGSVAVGVVTGYALKTAQTARVLGTELSFGSEAAANVANRTLAKAGQLGVEFVGGNHLSPEQRIRERLIKAMPHDLSKLASMEKALSQTEAALEAAKSKFQKGVRDPELIAEVKGLAQSIKLQKSEIAVQQSVVEKAKEKVMHGIEKGGVNQAKASLSQNGREEKAKAKQEALAHVRERNQSAANDSQYKPAQEAHRQQELLATGTDGIPVRRTANAPRNNVTELPDTATRQEAKIRRNANLGDTERLQASEDALRAKGLLNDTEGLKKAGLMDEQGRLTDRAHELILGGHRSGKPVFEQDFASIRAKAEASRGLPKEWKKELMDQGLMGTERVAAKAGSIAELQKIDRLLANRIESLLDPNRRLKFPTGSMGEDWAKAALDNTLIPLREAAAKMGPEFYEQVRRQVHESVEKQLVENIVFRTNRNFSWIEQNGVRDCFEKLAKAGFPMRAEAFTEVGLGRQIKEEFDRLIDRAALSARGINSMEKTGAFETYRKTIAKELSSKEITEEWLAVIQTGVREQYQSKLGKAAELRELLTGLNTLKNRSVQEVDAIRNATTSLKNLETEIAAIEKFSKGPEISNATKLAETNSKAHQEIQGRLARNAEYEKVTHRNSMGNHHFRDLAPEAKAERLIAGLDFDLSGENLQRFFYLTYHELSPALQKKFTPEIMAKYGCNAAGELTDEAIALGVHYYGVSQLRKKAA